MEFNKKIIKEINNLKCLGKEEFLKNNKSSCKCLDCAYINNLIKMQSKIERLINDIILITNNINQLNNVIIFNNNIQDEILKAENNLASLKLNYERQKIIQELIEIFAEKENN